MPKQFSRQFLLFLAAFFLLNLVQGFFTELIYDEAYYWVYAQDLNWGYFDHPPMVAFLIWLSSLFFDGELGVRFMSCILNAGTIVLIWTMVDSPKKRDHIPHFFLMLFAMALFNAYGFLTLPDTPLLFFTALFLFIYKSFIAQPNLMKSLLMGLVMACLMYSKYHAILVIMFVLVSNLSLLKNKYAWAAVGFSLVSYAPHLHWLFENEFVSIEYHISERPNQPYTFTGFTLGYLLNLIVNFGLLFPWFYYALFTNKAKDTFTRALSYLSIGVIVFFFFSTLHRRSQAQWVIVICIPMAVLAFRLLLSNAKAKKWMFTLSLISAVLLVYARIWLVHQPLLPKIYESHGNEQWVSELKGVVGDTPVIFENSYRTASMYHFYSGYPSFSLNNIYYRRNQYSINDSETRFQSKRIAYISYFAKSGDFYFQKFNGDTVYGRYIDPFISYRKLRAYLADNKVSKRSDWQKLTLYNPYEKDIELKNLSFRFSFLNKYKQLKDVQAVQLEAVNDSTTRLKAKDSTAFLFKLPETKMENPSYVKFSISEFNLPTGINSSSIPLE